MSIPGAMRRHVVILGPANAGKSTLFNALTGQDNAIVSPERGTTTDPVSKSMELLPFGPIVLTDTAGLDDETALGASRVRKADAALRRAVCALYALEAGTDPDKHYESFLERGIPHLLVITKSGGSEDAEALGERYPEAVFPDAPGGVEKLRSRLSGLLSSLEPEEKPLLGDLVPAGGTVILVTPIDSEAPKGRLILPQVQVLRDCLDHGVKAVVVRETEFSAALRELNRVDLVVTDSQVFGLVDELTPPEVPLTSFSMLLARQRGNFRQLLRGADSLETLPDGGRILMLEGCTHNHTHEDIGRAKIPAILKKRTGKDLSFDVRSGYDFPEDLSGYDMAVMCGSCMLAGREIAARLEMLEQSGVPVTNYGMLLAWGAGSLRRLAFLFEKEEKGKDKEPSRSAPKAAGPREGSGYDRSPVRG